MSLFQNILKNVIENEQNDTNMKKLICKELIEKKKPPNPFHIGFSQLNFFKITKISSIRLPRYKEKNMLLSLFWRKSDARASFLFFIKKNAKLQWIYIGEEKIPAFISLFEQLL